MRFWKHLAAPCFISVFAWHAQAARLKHRDQSVISRVSGDAMDPNGGRKFPDLRGLEGFRQKSWRGLQLIAAGTAGEAWYGQHDESGTGKWISKVVKLLAKQKHDGPNYYTKGVALDNPTHPLFKSAKSECAIAQELSEYYSKDWHERHVIHCFEHNIPDTDEYHTNQTVADRDEVLFLVLEYGGTDLWSVMTELSVADVFGVYFKLVEALEHVAGYGIIHHDVKPENVVIKTKQDRPDLEHGLPSSYQVLLIDFGGVVIVSPENQHVMTTFTREYAPGEAHNCDAKTDNSACQWNYEICPDQEPVDECPTKFDMFSAASVLWAMFLDESAPHTCKGRQQDLYYECCDWFAQNPAKYVDDIFKSRWGNRTMSAEFGKYKQFFKQAIQGWRLHARDRTSAALTVTAMRDGGFAPPRCEKPSERLSCSGEVPAMVAEGMVAGPSEERAIMRPALPESIKTSGMV